MGQRRRIRCLAGGFMLLLVTLWQSSLLAEDQRDFFENPAAVYGQSVVRYQVTRDGDPVGTQTITFVKKADKLEVLIDAQLAVKYLGMTVYRFRYEGTEIWQDNRLLEVTSVVTDNFKKARRRSAVIKGELMEITDNGKTRTARRVYFASNYWHPAILGARRLFHTTHGNVYNVVLEDLGHEPYMLPRENGGSVEVQARHYRYKAKFKADVWYDSDNRWLGLAFPADDGSLIEYRCLNCKLPESKDTANQFSSELLKD